MTYKEERKGGDEKELGLDWGGIRNLEVKVPLHGDQDRRVRRKEEKGFPQLGAKRWGENQVIREFQPGIPELRAASRNKEN